MLLKIMKINKQKTVQRAAYFVALVSLIAMAPVFASPPVKVLDPGLKHYGKTYGELTGDWLNWVNQFPFATSPITENGQIDCSRGQKGKIWFLAGNFGGVSERTCTIPLGKALFFSALNGAMWFPEDGDNINLIRTKANNDLYPQLLNQYPSVLQVIIDEVPVADPYAYMAQSQPGGFRLENGPLIRGWGYDDLPEGRFPAVAWGFYYLLAPLPKGRHDIVIRSTKPGFSLDVTFHLTVGK